MPRRKVPLIVAAVVQPVSKRLSRIEALLMEMRYEQGIQTKRVMALREQVDVLLEHRDPDHPGQQKGTRAKPA